MEAISLVLNWYTYFLTTSYLPLCWLLSTSVLRKAWILRTDVPRSQHNTRQSSSTSALSLIAHQQHSRHQIVLGWSGTSGSVAKSCPVVTYSKRKQERMTQERTFQELSVCLILLPNPSALSRTPNATNLHASATHPVNVSVAINEQSLCLPLRRE